MAELKHVYVIGPADGPYKVGIATDLKRRLASIQTGSAERLALHMHTPAIRNAPSIEAGMHGLLKAYRLVGEWFGCEIDTIREAFSQFEIEAAEIEQAVQFQMPPYTPSGEAFRGWLEAMRTRRPSYNEATCAAALGASKDEMDAMKRDGADLRTALACRALFHSFAPWPD